MVIVDARKKCTFTEKDLPIPLTLYIYIFFVVHGKSKLICANHWLKSEIEKVENPLF